ncbi:MAG: hypothetical protein MJ016_03360, partial [Victivallaceae bacterium]|nr:hypothetical protein [Victivallaceae bacterium]
MVRNSVKLPDLSAFRFPETPRHGHARVIALVEDQLITERLLLPVGELAGLDVARLAVLERHGKNGNIAFALVAGSGLRRGALATTIAHDSHNVLVLGKNDGDMRFAVEALREMQGGAVAVLDGKILAAMSLPVGGLMSESPAEVVAQEDAALDEATKKTLGMTPSSPLLTLSFLSLPV